MKEKVRNALRQDYLTILRMVYMIFDHAITANKRVMFSTKSNCYLLTMVITENERHLWSFCNQLLYIVIRHNLHRLIKSLVSIVIRMTEATVELSFGHHIFLVALDHFLLNTLPTRSLTAAEQYYRLSVLEIEHQLANAAHEIISATVHINILITF